MSSADKVVSPEQLVSRVDAARDQGKTVALANGLFDLLHVGHLRYLEGAANEADLLIVAINSDRSARQLRGPTRPVVPASERAELVAGFRCVGYVTVFDAPNVRTLLRELRPDVHCKGTDYRAKELPEAEVAAELGIRIAIVGDPKEHASSSIIRRIRARQDPS